MRNRPIGVIGALVVLLSSAMLLLGASGSTTTKDTTGGNSPDEIRIGLIAPMSGAVPSFGVETRNGVELAIREWNARGGIGGRRIRAVVKDGQCSAGPGVQAATELIYSEGVRFIIGEVCSAASIPISEIANAARVLEISPTSTNLRVTVDNAGVTKQFIFRNCFIDPYQGQVAARFVYGSLGARTAFVMGDSGNDYVSGIRDSFLSAFARLGGTIVGRGDYTGELSDFSEILSRIQATKPDVVFLPDYYNVVNLVARQARERGIDIPFVGGDGWDSRDLDLEATEGSYFINHFSDQDPRDEVRRFLDDYERSFPEAEETAGVHHMIAALAYDAATMLLQAIADAGSEDTQAVRRCLESVRFSGVTGDLSFDAAHNPIKTAFIFGIRHGSVRFVGRVDP